jgi:hypothetical protein
VVPFVQIGKKLVVPVPVRVAIVAGATPNTVGRSWEVPWVSMLSASVVT